MPPRAPMKIKFKSIRTEADMVQTLQNLLPIGQATLSDVTELLAANGVEYSPITPLQAYNSSLKNPSVDHDKIDSVIVTTFDAQYPWLARLVLFLRLGIVKSGFDVLFFFSDDTLVEVNAHISNTGL